MSWRTLIAVAAIGASMPVLAATAGQAAPNFTLTDTRGKTVQLSDFRGSYVVLEWTNPGCPFVRNHYNTRNMQTLQQGWGPRGVVWLSIDSSAPGEEGNYPPGKLNGISARDGAARTALLLDPDGKVGRLSRKLGAAIDCSGPLRALRRNGEFRYDDI